MKRIISFLLTLCLVMGTVSAALAESALEGKPWTNPEWPQNLPDERPALEENYYLYVNYDRHKQLAEDPNAAGSTYTSTEDELAEKVWDMIDRGESTEAKALRILAGLMLDEERRNREGLEPLMAYVRRVQATQSLEELSALCREDGFLFGDPYVMCRLKQSIQDPEKFTIELTFNEPVPMITDENGVDTPNTKQVEEELLLMGWDADGAKEMTERLLKYQTEDVTRANFMDTAEPTTEELLNTCTPLHDQLISQGMLLEGQALDSIYQITDIVPFFQVRNLYREENLDLFKAIISLSMYRFATDYLDLATYAKARNIEGDVDLKAEAHYRMDPYLAEQAYAITYVTQEQRDQVMFMVEEYRQALANILQNCAWLSEESKKNAVEKALGIKAVVVVNTDEFIDYEPLLQAIDVEGINYLQAGIQCSLTIPRFSLTQAGKPFDRSHRLLNKDSMLQANAVYDPDTNTLFVMAGILLPEFYDPSSRETLMACPGQFIAHEMAHAFDPSCIQINADGQRISPLTDEDLMKYQERVLHMVDNMNRIELADGVNMNGLAKVQEMFADLVGLRVTLDVIKKTEGFDYDRFFQALTKKFFRSYQSKDDAMERMNNGAHPPYYTRINYTFGQYDEFYQTYPTIVEGTPMYYPIADRETIW